MTTHNMTSPNGEPKPADLHKDHRVRLKTRFEKEGLSSFAPHEVLELILFYAIPQQDTNPLAHILLDRFKTLSGVCSASKEALCAVPGVSEHTATLLRLILPAANYAVRDEDAVPVYDTAEKVSDFVKALFHGIRQETVFLLLFDNAARMIDCIRIHDGSVNSAALTIPSLVGPAVAKHAAVAVLAHNHPSGIAIPSPEDLDTTSHVRDAFELVGVHFSEHFLVAPDGCVGLISGWGGKLPPSRIGIGY